MAAPLYAIEVKPPQAAPFEVTPERAPEFGRYYGRAGAELEKFGKALAGAGETLLDAKWESQATGARTDFMTRMGELEEKYRNDPDPATRAQRFNDDARMIEQQELARIEDPRRRETTQLHMRSTTLSTWRRVATGAASDMTNEQMARLHQEREETIKEIGKDPTMTEPASRRYLESIVGTQQSGLISPMDAFRLRKTFSDERDRAVRERDFSAMQSQRSQIEKESLSAVITFGADAEGVVERNVQRFFDASDKAVADGTIEAKTGLSDKTQSSNAQWADYYVGVADGKGADEIAAYREQLRQEYGRKGKIYARFDALGYARLDAELARLQQRKLTGAGQEIGALDKSMENWISRKVGGLNPNRSEWDAMVTASTTMPGGDIVRMRGEWKLALAEQLNAAKSSGDADAIMRDVSRRVREAGLPGPFGAELVDFGNKIVRERKTQQNDDQLGYAERSGVIQAVWPVGIAEFKGNPNVGEAAENLAIELGQRVAQAQAVGRTLQRQPQYLRPAEKEQMKEIAGQGDERTLAMVQAVVKGSGDAAPTVLAEIGEIAPKLQHVGDMLMNGGSRDAAFEAMQAQRARAGGHKLPSIVDEPMRRMSVATQFGTAFSGNAGTINRGQRVIDTAGDIAAFRGAAKGITDPKLQASEAQREFDRALQEAAGARFLGDRQYGGVTPFKPSNWWFGSGHVAVPAGVRTDQFGKMLETLTDADLRNLKNPLPQAYTARDIKGMMPVLMGKGYAFERKRSGGESRWILDRAGRPWVLEWDEIEPVLARRVPEAMLGER